MRLGNASWYFLWIDDETGTRVRRRVTAANANCTEFGTECRYRFNTGVSGPTSWWERAWNSDGERPWSNGDSADIKMSF